MNKDFIGSIADFDIQIGAIRKYKHCYQNLCIKIQRENKFGIYISFENTVFVYLVNKQLYVFNYFVIFFSFFIKAFLI